MFLAEDPKYAHLVSEWHPTKNGAFTPQNISSGSGRSIWWQCAENAIHEWEATPLSRKRNGCPFCSGKRVLTGYNDLATTHPHLLSEWHPTLNTDVTPQEISAGSNAGVFWVCSVGPDHVWNAAPNTRKRGSTCPYCSNRKVLAGFNDLASKPEYAHIVAEWHPAKNGSLLPSEVAVSSNIKVWWQCADNHEWEAVISNRTRRNTNCPQCKNGHKKELRFVSDNPLLLKEWSPANSSKPDKVGLGSTYMAKWVCSTNKEHHWTASVVNRSRGMGSGCPVCLNFKVIPGHNDLGSSKEFAAIAAEWHPDNTIDITTVGVGSDKKAKWWCAKRHVWEAKIYNRTMSGQNCPECGGRPKWNSKKKKVADYPDLAAQWHPDNTSSIHDVPFRSAKKFKWVCPKNLQHVWIAAVQSRALDGLDCPVCAGRIVIAGVNDLGSYLQYAHLVKEWHPENSLRSSEVTYSSNFNAKWRCQNNQAHVWETTVSARTRTAASGCPHCALAQSASKGEEEIAAILTLLGFPPERSMKNIIPRRELDIYIPDKKFAVEFNGLYWHSDAIRPDKDYHKNKVEACDKAGIYLYQVWEDDWRNKRDLVIRGLAHRLGATHMLPAVVPGIPDYWHEKIGAESTVASFISNSDAREFLDNHHIQGFTSGSRYVGLTDKANRLRAAMVLAYTGNYGELQIDRYASSSAVVGGFAKALKFAEQELPVESFIAVVDRENGDGSLYKQNGFVLDKVLDADYSYLIKGSRTNKANYQIERFKTDRELLFEENLTEEELARLNGLRRIWDSGKNRYVKNVMI